MGKILRINMSDMAFKTDELGEYAGLGGRALTSSIIWALLAFLWIEV